FKGMLLHARDGEPFRCHNRGTAAAPNLFLANATGLVGRGRCYLFPYLTLEAEVLRHLREIDPRDVLPRGGKGPSAADVLRAKLGNIRKDLAGIQADLKGGYSKALAAVLRDMEAEEEVVARQLQDELAESVRPVERAWKEFKDLAAMVEEGGNETRL